MKISRETIVEACKTALAALPSVRAAFLGGSEAFGRHDRYSDIDLGAIAPMADAPVIFAAVEAALEALSPIALRLEMPLNATWPELSQRFYRLKDTDEFLMIDFCQLTPAQMQTFLEPTRHGHAVVLFDRDGLIKPVSLDQAAHQAAIERRLAWLKAAFPMFQNLTRKAVLRGDDVEATATWMNHTLRPLVDLLRIRHCPARFDYGFRYTRIDLPAEAHTELRSLLWPSSGQDLLARLDRADALFQRTLQELGR
ncbi:MAG: hypothetical protein H6841_04900 [Planctomycetes bacterium]|nr:hypothetical protein [Planctomycetota bacterium]MCB9934952.1 hypothetical protein [Planctomycetota bacterium]